MDGSANNLEESTSPYSELFDTASTDKLDRFQSLALEHAESEGIGVADAIEKIRDERKRGSLHFAASGGSLEVCKYLLDTLKLDVDPKDKHGHTPLYQAIGKGHFDTSEYLLEKGANADALGDENFTPLHFAARIGDTKIMALLLSRGVRVDVITKGANATALQFAAAGGHQSAVKMLLDHGAIVGVGELLHVAAQTGNLNFCKYLHETLKLDVDSKDENGQTPLYQAITEGHLDTVRYLLEKGANADASDDRNCTPLHYAARTGDTEIMTLLLSKGVRVDATNIAGSALQLAAAKGYTDAVKMLLDHGANPDVGNTCGTLNPLNAAIVFKYWECMELLLQAGADPNVETHGSTPLVIAAMDRNIDLIKRLLEAGADPNYKMNAGLTVLEMAALDRNYQMIDILFPVTSRIPTYPDWSIAGLMRHVNSDAKMMQMMAHATVKFHQAKSKGREAFQEEQYLMAINWFNEALVTFPKDPALLSNVSACYARLGFGIEALDYADKCMLENPEWPKAYYRRGVALNILKWYEEAADAFNKGLTLDPTNEELKDAYMKAVEARLNSVKVEEDSAE